MCSPTDVGARGNEPAEPYLVYGRRRVRTRPLNSTAVFDCQYGRFPTCLSRTTRTSLYILHAGPYVRYYVCSLSPKRYHVLSNVALLLLDESAAIYGRNPWASFYNNRGTETAQWFSSRRRHYRCC